MKHAELTMNKLELLKNELKILNHQKKDLNEKIKLLRNVSIENLEATDIKEIGHLYDEKDVYNQILKEMEDIKDQFKSSNGENNLLHLKDDDFKELECNRYSEQKVHDDDDELCGQDYCGSKSTHYLKLKLYGISLNILLCTRHAEQLYQMNNYYKGRQCEDITDDGIPIIPCKDDGRQTYFYCRFCQKIHYHGIGSDGSHKIAHCINYNSPYKKKGYYLKVVGKDDYCYGLNEDEEWIKNIFPGEDLEYLGLKEDIITISHAHDIKIEVEETRKIPTMEQHKRWGKELKNIDKILAELSVEIGNNAGIKYYYNELKDAIDHVSQLKNNLEAKMSRDHKEEWNEDGKGLNIYYGPDI